MSLDYRRKLSVAASLARSDPRSFVALAPRLVWRTVRETRTAEEMRLRALRRTGGTVEAARILVRLGRRDEAIAELKRSIEIAGSEADDLRFELGSELYMEGRYDEAMQTYEEAIRRRDEAAARAGLDSLGVRFLFADWTGPIGHIALLDVHAKLAALGLLSQGDRVLVAKAIGNPAYLELWQEHYPRLVSTPSGRSALQLLLPYLRDYSTVIRLADGTYMPLHAAATMAERRWRSDGRGPLLSLPEKEREYGRASLVELGLPPDAWFAGLHVREDPTSPRDIHNAAITTYELAIDAIVERGGWVVRMGDPRMTPLRPRERVLDYGLGPARNDRVDVFICAECRFFVGTASGPIGIPPTFGRPCVETNWAPFAFRHWFPGNLFVAKLYRSKETGELLPFRQVLASDIGYTPLVARLESLGVELVDNSAEELRDVVVEMMDRLDGTVEYSQDDELLQQRLDELPLRKAASLFGCSRGGRDWLRSRVELLAE